MGVFTFELTHLNNANAEEQCHTVHVFCGNGSTNFGLACGETYQEYLDAIDGLHSVVCDIEVDDSECED